MKEQDYIEILMDVIRSMEQSKYTILTPGTVSSDISDIGNDIGFAVGKHIVRLGLDKNDFIRGIKHGISLTDGTH
jgi:hypothetical protein